MSKWDDEDSSIINGEKLNFFGRLKEFLFVRNYTLITSLKLTFSQAVVLIIIEEMQKISIITRYSVNPTLADSPEMAYIDQLCKIFLLDLFQINDSNNLIITILLLLAQILVILVFVIPFKGEIINEILSKYIVTFMKMVLTFPSITLSVNFVMHGVNIGPNLILYLLTVATNLIYESMQL
jgi:hypothetical protein